MAVTSFIGRAHSYTAGTRRGTRPVWRRGATEGHPPRMPRRDARSVLSSEVRLIPPARRRRHAATTVRMASSESATEPAPSTIRNRSGSSSANCQVRGAHPLEEGHLLGVLESVPFLAPPSALEADLDRHVEEDGEVGPQAAGRERLEAAHLVEIVAVAGALVGHRRVDVAGADDPLAALEGRADDAADVLRAARGIEQGVGARVEVVAHAAHVEHDPPDFLAERRAARLLGQDRPDAHARAASRRDAVRPWSCRCPRVPRA